jgi:hypothetical protein
MEERFQRLPVLDEKGKSCIILKKNNGNDTGGKEDHGSG